LTTVKDHWTLPKTALSRDQDHMYLQFVLAALLALSGLASPAPQAQDSSAPQNRVVGQTVAGASASTVTADRTDASGAPSDGVQLKDLAIVVPPVEPSGQVATPDGPLETQTAAGVVVADQLVTPKRVESEVVKAVGFQTLGVTWPEKAKVGDLGGQVRTRTHGKWSGWVDLEPSDSAPDAGTADAARAVRGGTDPVSIGNADAVQLAFTATAKGGPKGLSLALIGSAEKPAAGGAVGSSAVGSSAGGEATIQTVAYSTAVVQAAVAAPTVITRAQWGAPAQACTPSVATTLVGAVVHHTADPNTYTTVAQAEQQIRNDAVYHISKLGWCDIGYNFVVDKWGNIYEGRAHSLTQAVVGAHAGGFNTGTVGVAMLGTYSAAPSAATQQAVARIIGWRLGSYGVDPRGSMLYHAGDGIVGSGQRYFNKDVVLPRVFGHRDVWYTACPGNGGYAALPYIRAKAYQLRGPNRFSPIGHVDSVTTGPSTVTAAGWAIDPDSPAPIMVQMYIDGSANALTWANQPRPDVAAAYPAYGPNHGFTLTMHTTPGLHTVCLYAINVGPGTSNRLSCHTVTTANSPFGHVDSVTTGPSTVTASGWAIDPDSPAPIMVQMYIDGSANALTWANRPRPDVGAAYPTYGPNHGFTLTMNATPGLHKVCLFAINTGPGISKQISCHGVNLP
jgi:N-acetylmuramoyl-L-alanine amidase